jgi:hypothetical protein
MSSALTLQDLELPGPATTHPYVPDETRLHDIVQCIHRLLDWRVFVKSMALNNIHVVELEPLERVLDRGKDSLLRLVSLSQQLIPALYLCSSDRARLSAQTRKVCPSRRSLHIRLVVPVVWVIRLGHDDHTLPRNVVLLQELAKDDFGLPKGVHIGRVKGLEVVYQLTNLRNVTRRGCTLTLIP